MDEDNIVAALRRGEDGWEYAAADEIETLREENARLREALKPFSNMAQYIVAGTPDEAVCVDVEFTAGDLRAARAALESDND